MHKINLAFTQKRFSRRGAEDAEKKEFSKSCSRPILNILTNKVTLAFLCGLCASA
jgi:hypothetical protein